MNMKYVNSQYHISFWRRAFSLLVDIVIINLVTSYPFSELSKKYFGEMTIAQAMTIGEQIIPSIMYWAVFIISILALLYFTLFEYFLGQSPGQMLLRVKSVSIDAKKKKITFWRALISNCFILPYFPFFVLWIVEPIHLIIYKERFLEHITHTKTIHEFEKFKVEEYKLNKVK